MPQAPPQRHHKAPQAAPQAAPQSYHNGATSSAAVLPHVTCRKGHKSNTMCHNVTPQGIAFKATTTTVLQSSSRCHKHSHNGTTTAPQSPPQRNHKVPQPPPKRQHATSAHLEQHHNGATRYPKHRHNALARHCQSATSNATTVPQGTTRCDTHRCNSTTRYNKTPPGTRSRRKVPQAPQTAVPQGQAAPQRFHNGATCTAAAVPPQGITTHYKVPRVTTRSDSMVPQVETRRYKQHQRCRKEAEAAPQRYHEAPPGATSNDATYNKLPRATLRWYGTVCHKVPQAPPQRHHKVPQTYRTSLEANLLTGPRRFHNGSTRHQRATSAVTSIPQREQRHH